MTNKVFNNFTFISKNPPKSNLYQQYKMLLKYYYALCELIETTNKYRGKKFGPDFNRFIALVKQRKKVRLHLSKLEKRIYFNVNDSFFDKAPNDHYEIIVYYEALVRELKQEIKEVRNDYESSVKKINAA